MRRKTWRFLLSRKNREWPRRIHKKASELRKPPDQKWKPCLGDSSPNFLTLGINSPRRFLLKESYSQYASLARGHTGNAGSNSYLSLNLISGLGGDANTTTKANIFLVSPTFMTHSYLGTHGTLHMPEITFPLDLTLTVTQLRSLRSTEIELHFDKWELWWHPVLSLS